MKKDSLLRVLINVLGFPYGVNYDDITYVITFGKRMSNVYPRVTYDFIGSQAALEWFKKRYGYCEDVWDYASNITSSKRYLKYCVANGAFTPSGNPSTSAESVYRFINNEHDFTEDHTALSDARIEAAILLAAKAKHKKTRHDSRGQGWRDASAAFKALDL